MKASSPRRLHDPSLRLRPHAVKREVHPLAGIHLTDPSNRPRAGPSVLVEPTWQAEAPHPDDSSKLYPDNQPVSL